MFVAHHWCQGCSTHGGKSHLKKGANATGHFRSIPVVPLRKEFGHSPANGEPSHTHREDQGAQEIAGGFGLTCVPVRRWTFPAEKWSFSRSTIEGIMVYYQGASSCIMQKLVYLEMGPSNHAQMSDFCEERKNGGMTVWLYYMHFHVKTQKPTSDTY